jgi:hypothetical protein
MESVGRQGAAFRYAPVALGAAIQKTLSAAPSALLETRAEDA